MRIEATTETGTPVSFEINEKGGITAIVNHPKAGLLKGAAHWGRSEGKEGAGFHTAEKYILLLITKEKWNEIEEAGKATEHEYNKKVTEAFKAAGKVTISIFFHSGCTGFFVKDQGVALPEEYEKILQKIHNKLDFISEDYPGESDLICEISASEIDDIYNGIIDNQNKAKEQQKKHEETCFQKASETGKKIIIKQFSDECNDPNEECNIDTITVYAMPDGKKETIRSHTW